MLFVGGTVYNINIPFLPLLLQEKQMRHIILIGELPKYNYSVEAMMLLISICYVGGPCVSTERSSAL